MSAAWLFGRLRMYSEVHKLHEIPALKALFCDTTSNTPNRVFYYEANSKKAPCELLIERVVKCGTYLATKKIEQAKELVTKAAELMNQQQLDEADWAVALKMQKEWTRTARQRGRRSRDVEGHVRGRLGCKSCIASNQLPDKQPIGTAHQSSIKQLL